LPPAPPARRAQRAAAGRRRWQGIGGIDGSESKAGAVIGPHTLPRAAAPGLDARAALLDNDAYGFFSAIDVLLVTGPTLTNVNDFHAILVS
jgi:hydroxypyruvate reductase